MAREKSNCACGVQSPVIVLKTAATVLKIDVHNEGIFLRICTCAFPILHCTCTWGRGRKGDLADGPVTAVSEGDARWHGWIAADDGPGRTCRALGRSRPVVLANRNTGRTKGAS